MNESLIDRIYESAFIPDQWPGVLEELALLSNGAGGSLYVSGSDFTLFTASPSARERAEQAVRGGFVRRGKGLDRLLSARHAGFLTEDDLLSSDEFQREPLFREFWQRLGLGSVITTAFNLPTNESLILLITRPLERGVADRGVVDRLDALRPHLGRSTLLSGRLHLERARMASETLAALGLPALVFSESGKVLVANHLIEQLSRFICWRSQDRVALNDSVANRMLENALRTVHLSAESAMRTFPIRDVSTQGVMIGHVVPIRLSARDVFIQSIAVLLLVPVTVRNAPSTEIIQSLFDLTPSEARAARGLASGMTIGDIASQSSVSRNTVRSQVRGVLEKTGCKRQAEVVALLAGLSPVRIEQQPRPPSKRGSPHDLSKIAR